MVVKNNTERDVVQDLKDAKKETVPTTNLDTYRSAKEFGNKFLEIKFGDLHTIGISTYKLEYDDAVYYISKVEYIDEIKYEVNYDLCDLKSEIDHYVDYINDNSVGNIMVNVSTQDDVLLDESELTYINYNGELQDSFRNHKFGFEENILSAVDKELDDLSVVIDGNEINTSDNIMTDSKDSVILLDIPRSHYVAVLKIYSNGVNREYRICDVIPEEEIEHTEVFAS